MEAFSVDVTTYRDVRFGYLSGRDIISSKKANFFFLDGSYCELLHLSWVWL